MASEDDGGYGLNVGRFLADHRARWVVTAGPYGSGYTARWRGPDGTGRGQRFNAADLDALAVILAAEEARRAHDNR
jgi:hypothetical protein